MLARVTRSPSTALASALLGASLTMSTPACRPTAADASAAPSAAQSTAPCPTCAAEQAALQRWRAERVAALKGEQGWLALAGLHWLAEGEQRLGSGSDADLGFPAGAPAQIGTLTLRGGEVRLRIAAGVDARVDGRPITDQVLRSDADPDRPADRVQIGGRFTFLILVRGERLALRLYDAEAPGRREFAGLDGFPHDPAWRIEARFEPFTPPRRIDHPTVLGTVQPAEIPGVAIFTVDGVERRLTPILEHGPTGDELLFVFRDQTSGDETYAAGRFLAADMPQDGRLVLDFNRAHNPPCAFTPYATCPLPLPENRLALRIPAGEKTYTGAHAP